MCGATHAPTLLVIVAVAFVMAVTFSRLFAAVTFSMVVRMTMRVITRMHVITHNFIDSPAFLNGRFRRIVRMFCMRGCRIERMREARANIRLFRAIV